MSERKKKQNHGDENIVKLHIADHPVRLSFAAEPDPTAAQRIRNCLIDSFLRQDEVNRRAA